MLQKVKYEEKYLSINAINKVDPGGLKINSCIKYEQFTKEKQHFFGVNDNTVFLDQ